VPSMRLGMIDIGQVGAVMSNRTLRAWRAAIGMDLDGYVGAGLLAAFRVTLGDGGKTMWVEQDVSDMAAGPDRAGEISACEPASSSSASTVGWAAPDRAGGKSEGHAPEESMSATHRTWKTK